MTTAEVAAEIAARQKSFNSEVKAILDEEREARMALQERIDLLQQRNEDLALFTPGDSHRQSTTPAYNLPFANLPPRVTQFTHDQRDAWQSYIRGGDVADLKAALQVNVESDGGIFVRGQLSSQINSLVFESSPMRRLARVETISQGDAWEEAVETQQGACDWVSETQSRPATDAPDLGKIRIPVHEIYAQPEATQKLLDTADRDIEGWLNRSLTARFSRKENTAFVLGSGSGQPRGILSQPVSSDDDGDRPFGTVQYVVTGTSGAFPSVNAWDAYNILENCVTALKSEYRSGAVWLANRRTYGILRKIRNEFGDSLWSQSNEMAQPNLLLGFPAIEAEDMPDIAANSYSIAFGNFREAYVVVDHVAMRLLRDPFTNKPYVRFYTTKRVGGGLLKSEAYKIIKFGTS